MAREESDREDLLSEATALTERTELVVPGEPLPVVAGFRSDGRLSLYFGADPAFHFDANGRLRRAFVDGDLYRSRGDTLSRLSRRRTADTTYLDRHDLTPDELQQFFTVLRARVIQLTLALEQNSARIIRQVPKGGDVLTRLRNLLPHTVTGAVSPALKK